MSDQYIEAATPPQESLSSEDKHDRDIVINPTPSNVPSTVPSPVPDGGFKAWSQAAAAHLVIFNCWGYISSFGLFQSYYTTTFSVSPSAISWIGSVQILLIYFIGTFSGRALDGGHFRSVVTAGFILQVVGVFTTSVSTRYWHLFLSQGICKGLGDGLVFCPAVALVATYFTTKRSLAIGVMATGGATGGIFFPLIARQLLPRVGFGWTVRTMGFVVLFNACAFSAVARVRLRPRRRGPVVEWAAFAEPAYSLFCAGMFLNLWAVFLAYFYISSYARDILHVPSETALTLLLTMNAVGVPARLSCGFVADRLGTVNTLIPAVFFAGVLFFCWIAVGSVGGLYAFCVVYGFFGGGIQSLFPAACASLTTDLEKMGVRTGMCFSVVSIACLTGPPIAGALIQRHDGGYLYAQVFGGAALMGGTLTLVAARTAKNGWDWRKKM
ncbi:Aspyridones efflux protein apdF [Lasiodiplodia hormozganensis]|uniref:Aspyridones efflux protein apdF n=1 Tax=Lasiodiplodia hormozganensis TaxID=869390 RepID=A0AA39U1M8_9PEZI|nr:Aspyridones efflux protein apdF [Lasiodiplodia hormozganensis]